MICHNRLHYFYTITFARLSDLRLRSACGIRDDANADEARPLASDAQNPKEIKPKSSILNHVKPPVTSHHETFHTEAKTESPGVRVAGVGRAA